MRSGDDIVMGGVVGWSEVEVWDGGVENEAGCFRGLGKVRGGSSVGSNV